MLPVTIFYPKRCYQHRLFFFHLIWLRLQAHFFMMATTSGIRKSGDAERWYDGMWLSTIVSGWMLMVYLIHWNLLNHIKMMITPPDHWYKCWLFFPWIHAQKNADVIVLSQFFPGRPHQLPNHVLAHWLMIPWENFVLMTSTGTGNTSGAFYRDGTVLGQCPINGGTFFVVNSQHN